jgi:hypothetical protein
LSQEIAGEVGKRRMVVDIRTGSANYVARATVLQPIIGLSVVSSEKEIRAGLEKLERLWHHRLDELNKKGWGRGSDNKVLPHYQRAHACVPCMANWSNCKTMFHCDFFRICPWCWARRVMRIFHRAVSIPNRGLYQLQAGYHSTEWSININPRDILDLARDHMMTMMQDNSGKGGEFRRCKKKSGCLGAYSLCTLVPRVKENSRKTENVWALRMRALILKDHHQKSLWHQPTWSSVSLGDDHPWRVLQNKDDTQKAWGKMVQAALYYPEELIWVDPSLTIQALQAQGKYMLSNCYGVLRGSPKVKEAAPCGEGLSWNHVIAPPPMRLQELKDNVISQVNHESAASGSASGVSDPLRREPEVRLG